MAVLITLHECSEKYEWWLNELRSLGIEVHRRNEFNDIKEISSLAVNLKRYYYINFRNSSYCSD
jgi:hypothetical protein